jgi:uncharacterized membrane protein
MDQNIQKALWLGVGIMMFVAIVSTGLFLLNKGKAVAEVGGSQLDVVSEQLAMSKYNSFDNEVVSGSMVINTIKEYKNAGGEFIVVVTTSYPSTTQYISTGSVSSNIVSGSLTEKVRTTTDTDIQNLNDDTSSTYINPHAEFMAQLIYDNNDVVKGIVAVQQ